MKAFTLLFLFLFTSRVSFSQENQDKNIWSVCFSNGVSYSEINKQNIFLVPSNIPFYADQKEYYFINPSIRLNCDKHFWGLTLNEFNFGRKFSTGMNGIGYFINYTRFGFDVSLNHKVLNWKKLHFVFGESVGVNHSKDDGMLVNNRLLDLRESSIFIKAIPRISYRISEKFSLEIASLIQLIEANMIDETWSDRFNTTVPSIYKYVDVVAANGIEFQLSIEYRF